MSLLNKITQSRNAEFEIVNLFEQALAELADDREYDAIQQLWNCATQKVFEMACQLTQSHESLERELGIILLSRLGYRVEIEPFVSHFVQPFREESINLLLMMLEHETQSSVLATLAAGLGHFTTPEAIPYLVNLKTHPADEVRFGVVLGLLGLEDDRAIQALIELSTDKDSDVRDWATFGLGSILDELDQPDVRQALYRNLDDSDEYVRFEALMGLVIRRDVHIIDLLIEQLDSGKLDYRSDMGQQACAMLSAMHHEIDDKRLSSILRKYKMQPPQ